jgi:Fic/DOC family
MPHWDENSPELLRNLELVLERTAEDARKRMLPTLDMARRWQRDTMAGLTLPEDEPLEAVGHYRGEPGLEDYPVFIGHHSGVEPGLVAAALEAFESTLQQAVAGLDAIIPDIADLDDDRINAVVEVAAWAHAEWVRIHPFANGNGRTARNWANFIFLRYGLPPAVRPRPRPGASYGAAGAMAMTGNWRPTIAVFDKMLDDVLAEMGRKRPPTKEPR